ncbi:hypothetical protein ABZP36_021601 [Zizania latifolia]
MASSLWDWVTLGQVSNVAQLVGVDALGLVSMVVQAALAARRHRDACRQMAQHVDLVGGLLRELELADLMRREVTRRPLEQLRGALRRCYALVTACQDCGYLHRLLLGARMADELRAAQHEIDMYIRLIPLIALVDSTSNPPAKAVGAVSSAVEYPSNRHIRFPTRVLGITEICIQGDSKPCNAGEQPLGTMDLQEQKILDIEELVEICARTEESCPGFSKFDFIQIVHATDNFSEKRNIGQGGFGTIYKGQLPNGLTVAIKRLYEHATMFDFMNELQLAKIQHTNLIKLLGWCIHEKERILVYEFAHNGSLHKYIFGMFSLSPELCFSYSRSLSSNVAKEHTSMVVGTSGFKAPEYASRGVYSVKTDVFSFGVLVLVIISGRKNYMLDKQGDTIGDLVRDAWQMWRDQRLHELVDPSIGNGCELAEITQCTQVALLCTQDDPTVRPTMPDVAAMLSSQSTILLDNPKKPPELSHQVQGDDLTSTCMDQSSQTIDITITSSAPVSTRMVRIIIGPEV